MSGEVTAVLTALFLIVAVLYSTVGHAGASGYLAAMALVGAGFSVYLTYLELFVIDAICQWCVASRERAFSSS